MVATEAATTAVTMAATTAAAMAVAMAAEEATAAVEAMVEVEEAACQICNNKVIPEEDVHLVLEDNSSSITAVVVTTKVI